MDALVLLKKDHRKVGKLLKQGDKTTEQSAKRRKELFKQIKQELKTHEKIEETFFYPPLKKYKTTRSLTFEAYEEHGLIDELVAQIEKVAYDSEQWTAKFTVLKEIIGHHVEDEEKELFPKVRKVLDKARLKTMGEKMQRLKNQIKK